jgi:hypothetical protein
MKKFRGWLLVLVLSLSVLGGCSLVEEVTNTVGYVVKVQSYITNMLGFQDEIAQLTADASALANEETRKQIVTSLEGMKQEITQFKDIVAPDVFKELHQKMLDGNLSLEKAIVIYIEQLNEGSLDPKKIEEANGHLAQGLEKLNAIWAEIEQMGSQ